MASHFDMSDCHIILLLGLGNQYLYVDADVEKMTHVALPSCLN